MFVVDFSDSSREIEIRYDTYRRIESAKVWNDATDESACSDVTSNYDSNDAKIPAPISQYQQQGTSQSFDSSENEKNMKSQVDFDCGNGYGQQSIPILRDSNLAVTEFIVGEEHNEKRIADRVSGVSLESEESEKLEIDKDNVSQLLQLGVGDMSILMDDAVRKRDNATNYINITSEEDSTFSVADEVDCAVSSKRRERTPISTGITTEEGTESSMMEKAKCTSTLSMPKVVICLGEYLINTELNPSALQPFSDRILHAETLPDYFDPSIRPSAPTNSRQIYIPGNRVYARWLNIDDPGSYGAVSIRGHSLSNNFTTNEFPCH